MKRIINLSLLLLITLSFVSCLKDRDYVDGKIGHKVDDQNIIEIAWPNRPAPSRNYALDFVDVDTNFVVVPIRIASGIPAPHDITVVLDTSVTTAAIKETNYDHFPTNLFEFTGPLTVVIPKGQTSADFSIRVNPIKFDPSSLYAIAFKIASVSDPNYTISGNFGTFLASFGAKNDWDGEYKLTVRMDADNNDRPTVLTGVSWDWGGPVHLVTSGSTTIDLYDNWGFADYIQPIRTATGGASGFGSTHPRFTIDPATNKITKVENAYPNPSNGRQFQIDPTKTSYYDPATKTMYVYFIMTQPSFGPLRIADIFTYLGPR